MINDILTASGIPARRARFPKPPVGVYAVFFDDINADGADPVPLPPGLCIPHIIRHEGTIELYLEGSDTQTEERLEAEILGRGISFEKTDRQWLQDVQRYVVYYDLTYFTKSK